MRIRRRWVAVTMLLLAACTGGPAATGPRPSSTPTAPPATQAACDALNTSTANARAAVSHGGSVWALLFPTRVPVPAGTSLKVVWRVTGSGDIHLEALGPGGATVAPVWIEPHGGSTFQKPGEEWGSGFVFPSAGCWDLRASRRGVSGDIWIWVVPAADAA